MLNKDSLFSVYAPPEAGLPFLSVIFRAGRKHDVLATSFATAVEAETFNRDMRIELKGSRCDIRNNVIRASPITPDQGRAARELLGWTRDRLSQASGVGVGPLRRFEMSDGKTKSSTVAALRSALETAGIEFTNATGVSAGARVRELGSTGSDSRVHPDG